MNQKLKKKLNWKMPLGLSLVTLGTASFAVLHGCGTSSSSTTSSTTTNSYAGPGSHYTISMSSSTFTLNRYALTTSTSADFTVSGTVTAASTGFKILTVGSVTGTGGPAVGDKAYALEVPGMAVFIRSLASGSEQVVTAVASGSCPTANYDANWIKVKTSQNLSLSTSDAYGTFNFNIATSVASLPLKYSLQNTGTNLGTQTFTSANCSNGIMTIITSATDTAVLYLTTMGGAIVNTSSSGSSPEFILGMPAATLTGASLVGSYAGILYSDASSTGSKVKPIAATLTFGGASLSGTGSELADASASTTTGTTASINLTALNSPSKGLMTGTMILGGVTTNLTCMGVVGANGTTKNVINCAARDPNNTAKLFNFLLVTA